jgi:predicted DNA-binding protein|tara:strand:+ start:540 stop:719 length:180 start_codon:yes stop_codon:yes gene_type:complete
MIRIGLVSPVRKDTTISVDIKTVERLRALAKEDDRTISSLVRKILKDYEDTCEEKKKCT